MSRATLSIASSLNPAQRHTVQSLPNPREFSLNDWSFNVTRAQELDWGSNSANNSDFNYFAKNEGYQTIKNGMFGPDSNPNKIYSYVNYTLNPLDNEATNLQAYRNQGQTRVRDNMNPAKVMNAPTYQYPVNSPPNVWVNHFTGSARRR